MKVLVAHPGTQYAFFLSEELEKADLLYRFYSCFAISKKSFLFQLINMLPNSVKKKFSNRIISVQPGKVKNFISLEIRTHVRSNEMNTEKILFARNHAFQNAIPESALIESDVVIGFDTSSWILAERCKRLNKKFILDVSIGHPLSKEKIYDSLSIAYPEWKDQVTPKRKEYLDFENTEMMLADKIIVPSLFVKKTLLENNIPEHKVFINQFGTDITLFENKKLRSLQKKIRFLFMGTFSARKGLPFLLEVWKKIPADKAELMIAGYGKLPDMQLPVNVINKGLIAKDDRSDLFNSADVFIFPSFFEGLAQVQIEALASGLPVIGTTNSGAQDIITPDKDGFVIEPGNEGQLENAILFFIHHPEKISEMQQNAKLKSKKFTWNEYGDRWKKILAEI